jgi:hypothetical protein
MEMHPLCQLERDQLAITLSGLFIEQSRCFMINSEPRGIIMPISVPCQHIADYYQRRWENHKCIAFNLLRHGYRQWAEGRVNSDFPNNLYGG